MRSLSLEAKRALIKEANKRGLNATEVDDMLYVADIFYDATDANAMLHPELYWKFYTENGDEYLVPEEDEEDETD